MFKCMKEAVPNTWSSLIYVLKD